MKPSEESPKPPVVNDVSAPAKTEAPIAEPPKNLEFTEVPSTSIDPIATPIVADNETETKPSNASKPETATQPKASKPIKEQGPKKPVLAITFVVLVFVALAVVAYLAYTKST